MYKLHIYQTRERSESRRWRGEILNEDGLELFGDEGIFYGPDEATVIRKAQAKIDRHREAETIIAETERIIDLN